MMSGKGSETAKLMKERYSPIAQNDNEKIMESIQRLLTVAKDPIFNTTAFLSEVGRLIHRLFDFKEIAIGLKSKKDGLFRYEVLIGFREDVEKARRKITYTDADMGDSARYPGGVQVNKTTEFLLVEYQAYREGEEETFNRPTQLSKERSSTDELVEGDYIDVYLFGREGEPIGWFELSGTRSGKMPDRLTIKWLELLSSIMATILCEKEPHLH